MVAKKAQTSPIILPHERIRRELEKIFLNENIGPDYYRIYVNSSASIPGLYDVTLIWDGFDPWSITTRQVWLWDRLDRDFPKSLRQLLGHTHTYSAKEVIVSDDIEVREADNIYA